MRQKLNKSDKTARCTFTFQAWQEILVIHQSQKWGKVYFKTCFCSIWCGERIGKQYYFVVTAHRSREKNSWSRKNCLIKHCREWGKLFLPLFFCQVESRLEKICKDPGSKKEWPFVPFGLMHPLLALACCKITNLLL